MNACQDKIPNGIRYQAQFGGLTTPLRLWESALRYVDLNPVRAQMCELPSDHPFGSARAYRFQTGPSWLARERVIATVAAALGPQPRVLPPPSHPLELPRIVRV